MFLRLGKNDKIRKNMPIIITLIGIITSKGKPISKNKVNKNVTFTPV
jgi:hypothetical protein